MVAVRLISKSAFNICTAVGSMHGVIYTMFSRTELKLEDAFGNLSFSFQQPLDVEER